MGVPIESLLLSDRDNLYQRAVGIRRAAQVRLCQEIETIETGFRYETLGLVLSAQTPRRPLKLKRTHDENILFYLKFPYLFYELYPQVPLEQYDQLAISQYLYLSHVLMLDRLMDGKLLLEPQIAYWINSTYQKIISILSKLFPTDSPFWIYFEKCRIENTQALILERVQHTYRVSEYSDREKILIFSGKSAMAKAGLAALAYLSQQDVSDEIALSCEVFHIGLQLLDNLQDWRSDYRDHHYTPLLTQVLLDNQLTDAVESSQRVDVNVIGTLIYKRGYAQASLKEAMDYFKLALYVVRDFGCPAWQNEILRLIQGCEERLAALEQGLRCVREKRKLQAPNRAAQPNTQLLWQDIPILAITSLQQFSTTWVEAFCQAAQVDVDILCECADRTGDSTIFIQTAYEVLERCTGLVPPPSGLQIYLCNIRQIPASVCFEYEQKWQIILNQAAFSGNNIEAQLNICREHLAYQYGCMSRLRHVRVVGSLLDEMCVKGFGLLFVAKILSGFERSTLLPKGLIWFERNKQYLWQEVQPYLASPLTFDFALALKFDYMVQLLSYDLIASYCERMGNESLRHGVQTSSEDILNKSTVLMIANRIAGEKSVRFDL